MKILEFYFFLRFYAILCLNFIKQISYANISNFIEIQI